MVSLSEKILSLVLPARPYALKERFLRELDKNSGSPPKTLLFQAANSVINRTVDDQMVRKSVIDFFLNEPIELLNCQFLRARLDLFSEIFAQLARVTDPKFATFHVCIFQNRFGVKFNGKLIMMADGNDTKWPFIFSRIAFLNKIREINITIDGEHQLSTEALAEQCNNFLKLFRRTRNYSNQSSEVTYQKEQVIFANSHIQALFIGRLDIRGRDLDWGVVV